MSITKVKENLLIGAATTLEIGGTDMGPTTEDGVTISVDQSFYDRKIDQVAATVKKTMTDRKVTLSFTLEEADLARMHIALGLGASALSDSSLTIDDSAAAEATLLIVGVAPGGSANARTQIFDAVIITGNASHKQAKDDKLVLPIEAEAIYDLTNSRFGIIGDAAA